MARARYQVLVIPYCIEDSNTQFCLFRRSDIGIWQFIAGLQRKQHRVKSRLIHNGYGLHSTRGVHLRTPLIFGIYILHNAVSVSDAKVCAHISNHKPRVVTDEDCPHLTELFILEDFDFVIHDWLPFRHQMCHFDF